MANQIDVYEWGIRLVDGVCASQTTTVANQKLNFNLLSPYLVNNGLNIYSINFPKVARKLEFTAANPNTFTIKGAVFGNIIEESHVHAGGTSFTTNYYSDVYSITVLTPETGIEVGNAGVGFTMPKLQSNSNTAPFAVAQTIISVDPVLYTVLFSVKPNFNYFNLQLNFGIPFDFGTSSSTTNTTLGSPGPIPISYQFLIFGMGYANNPNPSPPPNPPYPVYPDNPQNGALTLTLTNTISE